MGLTLAMTLIFEFSRSYVILTIWWSRSGVRIYQIVTGVTSVVGVPSTHLVCNCLIKKYYDFSVVIDNVSMMFNASGSLFATHSICHICGPCCQKQVSQAKISNCIPQYSVGCSYLSLSEIPASSNTVLIYTNDLSTVYLNLVKMFSSVLYFCNTISSQTVHMQFLHSCCDMSKKMITFQVKATCNFFYKFGWAHNPFVRPGCQNTKLKVLVFPLFINRILYCSRDRCVWIWTHLTNTLTYKSGKHWQTLISKSLWTVYLRESITNVARVASTWGGWPT